MLSALPQFEANLLRVRELGTLADVVTTATKSVVDVSDIFRSQIVLVVSALDFYIHEIVRLGMIEIAKGSRAKCAAYLRFPITLSVAESALGGTSHENWMGDAVRERHSWISFQDPDKVADACRLVSDAKLWEEIGRELGLSASDAKATLKIIVDRRNKIAHEADIDPTNPAFRWPISRGQANDAIDFIEHAVRAINKILI